MAEPSDISKADRAFTMNDIDLDTLEESPSPKIKQREVWSKQADFVVTILGLIVGYGNLWRFPYICQKNGGGAFLIPYMFFLVTCGLPLMYLEMAVGQFAGKSNVHVWSICPLFKGVGVGQFIVSFLCIICYQNILAWSIYYMGMSCQSILPWTSCQNEWNTPECVEDKMSINSTMANETNMFNSSANFTFSYTEASEEFWQLKTLSVSTGVEHMGKIQWHLALSLLASWVLVFLCLIKGVKSAGKVVYVTATAPYILLVILLVRTALLPGAVDGVLFYLKPDFKKLLEFQVWLDAFLQVFFSLGPGWGCIIGMSSYNKFNYKFKRNSILLTFAGEGTSFFSGFVIFTVLGAMANYAQVNVSEVTSSGPGLIFVVYPAGLSTLPLPQLWSFLFFLTILTVGLDSMFAWMETLLTALIDQYPKQLRKRRVLVNLGFAIVCFLAGLIFTTEGGVYYFQLFDWYCASISVVFFAFCEIIGIIWIYGSQRFSKDIELMTGQKMPFFYKLMLGYITPVFIGVTFLLVMIKYKPPKYGSYVYPSYVEIIGWMMALVSIVPVPLMAVITVWKSNGTLRERLSKCCRPDLGWRPSPQKYWEMYAEKYSDKQLQAFSCLSRFK